MRKILIITLIVLLLVVGYLMTFNGLSMLGIDILSISQIKEKSSQLDEELTKVTTLTSIEQPKAMSDLNNSAKQLMIAKEEYNDKILYSSSENIVAASQTRPYETEYLWTTLGNHAKKNTINLKYELRQASSGASEQYDIYFTVTGSYVSISEFVAALENDSSLNFKIENFKLIPNEGSTDILQATFVVKDINVKVDNVSSNKTQQAGTTQTTQTSQTTSETQQNQVSQQ